MVFPKKTSIEFRDFPWDFPLPRWTPGKPTALGSPDPGIGGLERSDFATSVDGHLGPARHQAKIRSEISTMEVKSMGDLQDPIDGGM